MVDVPAPGNLLAERLATAGIRRVAIIDDAFDPPVPAGLLANDVEAFRAALRAEPGADAALRTIDAALTADSEFANLPILRLLWDQHARADRLGELIRELFDKKLQQLAEVNEFKPYLEELGLEVATLGKNDPIENAGEIQIAFLDYYLGEPDDASSVTDSSDRAKVISTRQAVVVLMSSKDTVHEGDAENFRDSSGLIRGLFSFIPKKLLGERASLQGHLAMFSLDIAGRFVVQKFVREFEGALVAATDTAQKKVRGIAFEDYGFVERLSLRTEGQPLGEYMLSLIEAMMNQLVRQQPGLHESVAALDKFTFEGKLLTPGEMPTRHLAEFYTAAVCEQPIEALGPHPLAPQDGVPADALYLQFGDLFVDDAGVNTAVVLTAACDLMFSSARPYQPERTVLLLPGRMEPVDKPATEGDGVFITELFLHSGDIRRIAWDADRAEQMPLSSLKAWLERKGLKRVARLRTDFAFDLQHRYAARVTRVGLPVAPPLSDGGDVDVVSHDGTVVNTISAGAIFATVGDKKRCFLGAQVLRSVLSYLTQLAQAIGEGDVAARKEKAAAVLASAQWIALLEGVAVGTKAKYSQINDALPSVGICFVGDQVPAKQFICGVRVRVGAHAEAEAVAAAE